MSKSTRSSTSRRIFVDTSGLYAFLTKRDRMHGRAGHFLRRAAKSKARFVTTDYVLDETVTLLMARGSRHLISPFFESVFGSAACSVEWMDPDRFEQTRRFLIKHDDKGWSFTDCFSFCVMRQLRLRDALTTDERFRQAGFDPLLADE